VPAIPCSIRHSKSLTRSTAGSIFSAFTHSFAGFEDALRDIGVGDFGLSRRIKAMANAFYGRMDAYSAAKDEQAFADALVRNLYRGDENKRGRAEILARYAMSARRHLAASDVMGGVADFGPIS
jgi:cytochrome b pre-mRNA-processing protein 3